MKLKDLFRKKSPGKKSPELVLVNAPRVAVPVNKPPMPEKPKAEKSCRFCKLVSSQGRSGEVSGTFLDGDPYTAEIMNQTGVDGRECYTLFIQNDPAVGFNEMPIKFCPNCGKNLKRKS